MASLPSRSALPVALALALATGAPAHAGRPCEAVAAQIAELLAYKESNKALVRKYQGCLAKADVCSLTQEHDGTDGQVRAEPVSNLEDDGLDRSAVMTAYQDDRAGTCLTAFHSGGSAAGWLFHGWSVHGGQAEPIPRMERFAHHADFESTKTLVALLAQAHAWAAGGHPANAPHPAQPGTPAPAAAPAQAQAQSPLTR